MKITKRVKLNMINILVFAITGVIFITGATSIHKLKSTVEDNKKAIEQHWRYEARQSLKNTINVFDEDIKNGFVDPYDEESVNKWANINFTGVRNGSVSSRGWVGEIGKAVIVSDQSILTRKMIEEIKYPRKFVEEYRLYDNPEEAKIIFDGILKGDKTTSEDRFSWNLNNNTEWIEYKYHPNSNGIDGEYKYTSMGKNPKFTRYVFLMKTNSNEIYEKYEDIFSGYIIISKLIYVTMGVSFISAVSIMITVLLKNKPVKDGGILYERR